MNNLEEQSKNLIANKQAIQSFQKPGPDDWIQEEQIPLAKNLKLNYLKLRQTLVKNATNKLIRQKEEITKEIEELLKQQEELDQEEEELKREELENLSGKELQKDLKLNKIESYNDVILPKTLPPLDQYKKLNLSEVKFIKCLRGYRYILTRKYLIYYGYPLKGYFDCITIYLHRSQRRNHSNYWAITSRCSLEHICVRCGRRFHVSETGEYFTKESCVFHWGRFKGKFTCCGGKRNSEGCERNKLHVWDGINDGENGPYDDFLCTQPRPDKSNVEAKVYALDCEMCYTGLGLEVARVSLVGYDGQVVYDYFVKPTCEVVDYCTRFSGVTARDLCEMQNKNLKTFAEAQKDLLQIIDADTILIGHSMHTDLRVLKIVHTKVIDTAHEFSHPLGFPYRHSLKNLAKKYLKRDIQCGSNGHDSVEDSRACLHLVMWKVRNRIPRKRPVKWIR